MWKFVLGSATGTSHVQSGTLCQDYCAGLVVGETLIAACADGAGSADLSHIGAKVAVDSFLQAARCTDMPAPEQIADWVTAAREQLIETAAASNSTPRQLACTFLAAIAGNGWTAFAQVGDGVIVFNGPEGYNFAFWPDNGEYANTTRFLSEADFREHLRIEVVEESVSEIAILTDGLQMLALNMADGKVHSQFFAPLFETLRKCHGSTGLEGSLMAFLNSPRVNERTDDDKSLFLAIRFPFDVSPILP